MTTKLSSLCVVVAVLLSDFCVQSAKPQCKDENGNNVEWFILYKIPKLQEYNYNTFTPNGEEYVYVDSNTASTKTLWTLPDGSMYSDGNPVANTIKPLTDKNTDEGLSYAVYNDQAPDTNSTSNGHTKGLLMFDKYTGFWLVHSVPRFPGDLHRDIYIFPENARENGQIFLCVSFPATALNSIAKQLRQQYPNIYDSFVTDSAKSSAPDFELLLQKKYIRSVPYNTTVNLKGLDGTVFKSFSKHGKFNNDIYSKILAPSFRADMYVETWRNGNGGKLPADCQDRFKVTNIERVKLNFQSSNGQTNSIEFSSTEDHSKWGVSSVTSKPWICIGTLNRMQSQFRRGGGSVCFKSRMVAKLFRSSIEQFDGCQLV